MGKEKGHWSHFEKDPSRVTSELIAQIFVDMWLITGINDNPSLDLKTPLYVDDETRRLFESPN